VVAAVGNVERAAGGVVEDMARCGHLGVVADIPMCEVAVDVCVVYPLVGAHDAGWWSRKGW
jgi:hypothetical protein